MDVLEFEFDVMRVLNGEAVDGFVWGAAANEACSSLKSRGLVTPIPYSLTADGRDALRMFKRDRSVILQ
jgi:hypothetical protein